MASSSARRGHATPRVLAILLLAALFASASAAARLDGASASTQDDVPEQVVIIVLDLSGSMNEAFDGSRTKLDVAKEAFAEAFADASDDAVVGLRVYGDQFASASPENREQNCTEDTRLVVPPGEANQETLVDQVNGFEAQGDTAIALALREASRDIPDGALGTVLLFSDGRDECYDADLDGDPAVGPSYGEDPCVVASEIAGEGTDLRIDRINTIGFGADAAAESELQCIADSTGGDYTPIESPEDAREILPKLVVEVSDPREALRLGGTPIEGTPTQDGAPEFEVLDGPAGVTEGRYVDTIEMNSERWYLAPGYGPGRGTFTATVFDLPAQEGIGFTMRTYVPETDQTFFEGRGDDDAGLPRSPATSIRCPGCGLTGGGELDMYWVLTLSSENEELTGIFDVELSVAGPAFGGLDTACREPQRCWAEAAIEAAEAEVQRLQEGGDGGETAQSDIDPALEAELAQARTDAEQARAAADEARQHRDTLESQLASAEQQGSSLPVVPLLIGLLGLLAGVSSVFVGRRSSDPETPGTGTGPATRDDAVIGQVVQSSDPGAETPQQSTERLADAEDEAADQATDDPLEVPEPGWYADPYEDGVLRWWDGTQWSGETRADGSGGGAS